MVSQEIDGGEGLTSSISSTIFMKYSSLKKTYRTLEAEKDELSLKLKELCLINEELRESLDESRKVERFYNTCGAIADRELLRERLRTREERIANLTSLLEAQESTVGDLTSQLHWITATMAAKESFFCKEAGDLRMILDEKSEYILQLEEKLHRSELLIQELEKLKQNYRLAFSSVNETLLLYKSNFKAVADCSEVLLKERDNLAKEVSEKEMKISKLSIFPQSPKTAIYLSQILHMIKVAEKSVSDPDSECIFTLFPSIKRIVDTMKTELWNQDSIEALTEMESANVQTEDDRMDSSTQYDLLLFDNKSIEADIPGDDYYECRELKSKMSLMEEAISEMEKACTNRNELSKELEKQLEEKRFLEKELKRRQEEVELLIEKLVMMKNELDYSDALLNRSMEEIEKEVVARKIASEQMNRSLQSTIYEYEESSRTLDTILNSSSERMEALENAWNEETERRMDMENECISKLEIGNKLLQQEINVNRSIVETQNKEISKLRADLSEKSNRFKSVQEKLLKAESIFERISSMDGSLTSPKISDDSDPDHLVDATSEKLFMYSKVIEEKLKIKESKEPSLDLDKLGLTNRKRKNLFKINVKRLKDNVKNLKNTLRKTRQRMKKTNYKFQESSKELLEFKEFYGKVHEEMNCLSEKVFQKNTENEKMKLILSEKDSKIDMLAYEKEKMEQVLLNIIKDMETSLSQSAKCYKTIGIETDSESSCNKIKSLTMKNKELSSLVTTLQGRIECLMNIPEKDFPLRESSSVGVQAVTKAAKTAQKETESIEKLKQDLNRERALSNQRKITNDKLREDNNRALAGLKVEHKKDISQLKDSFAKEKTEITTNYSKQLKKLNDKIEKIMDEKKEIEQKQKETDKILSIEKDKHIAELAILNKEIFMKNDQLAEQKNNYEELLCQRDRELEKEIKELRTEINNIITKKEELINKTKMDCFIRIKNLKKKFKEVRRRSKREKAAMLRKMRSIKKTLSNMKVCSSMNLSGIVDSEETSGSIRVTDVACQTCFYYTHRKNTDSSVQSVLSTNDTQSQTGDICCSHSKDKVDVPTDHTPVPGKLDHVIFGIPSSKKELSINFKERIKCSIQEANGTLVGAFLNKISPLSEVRDVVLHRDKNELVGHVAYLENELLKKTEDFNRNVEMYQDTIRRQKAKVAELEKLLEEEVQDTYSLRDRLALEYNRAERMRLEKADLQAYVSTLQRQIREHELDCESEREKSSFWKSHFESSMNQRKTTDELEVSLKRLQDKVDTAVRYEKKILEDIKADEERKERRSMALTTNELLRQIDQLSSKDCSRISQHDVNSSRDFSRISQLDGNNSTDRSSPSEHKNVKTTAKADFKLVLHQTCELRETWKHQEQPDNT